MLIYLSTGLVLLVVIGVAIRVVRQARADVATAQRELDELRQRVTRADAEVDAAVARLDELHTLRVDDVQRMRDDVRDLRENYERVLHRFRATQAIDGPLGSRRVQ